MSDLEYKEKYLKYKAKYINLKNAMDEQDGGKIDWLGDYIIFFDNKDLKALEKDDKDGDKNNLYSVITYELNKVNSEKIEIDGITYNHKVYRNIYRPVHFKKAFEILNNKLWYWTKPVLGNKIKNLFTKENSKENKNAIIKDAPVLDNIKETAFTLACTNKAYENFHTVKLSKKSLDPINGNYISDYTNKDDVIKFITNNIKKIKELDNEVLKNLVEATNKEADDKNICTLNESNFSSIWYGCHVTVNKLKDSQVHVIVQVDFSSSSA